MPRRAVALALLGLFATGCRPLRRLRRTPARAAAVASPHTAPTGHYTARPAAGPALRVLPGHYLVGALRRTDSELAAAPWPATPLVAAAEMDDGWRFAAADGTLYAARRFSTALRVVGALPARAPSVTLEDRLRSAHGVYSRGALVVIDDAQRAWVMGADNTPRPLPGEGYLSGAMRARDLGLFVREPGVALLTVDGGRTLQTLSLPAGAVAYAAALVEHTLRLDTSAGPMRLDDAHALVGDPDAVPLGLWLPARPAVHRAPHAHDDDGLVLPRDATQAAMMSPRRLGVIRHEQLVAVDAQTGLALDHYALPGSACALASSGAGLRAVCTHGGWARAVFALRPAGDWAVLRDELRGEALGDTAFDDTSPAWAVSAPCEARAADIDPTRLCLYDGRGGRAALHLPFDGSPVAFSDGVLLVTEAARSEGRTRAALVADGRIVPIELPMRGDDARSLRLHQGTLEGWVHRDDAPPAFARSRVTREGLGPWTMHPSPADMRQRLPGPAHQAIALGDTAADIMLQQGARPFVPLPSPVAGHPATLALAEVHTAYCVGPRCRLGEALEFTFAAVAGPLPFLARGEAPPRQPTPPSDLASLGCTRHPPTAAPTAVPVRWQQTPAALRLTWQTSPPTELGAPIPPRRAGARVVLRRAVEAPDALGLLERCDDVGCDVVVGSRTGLLRLALPEGVVPRISDVQPLDAGRAVVRVGFAGEGYAATRAWLIDPRAGAVLGMRDVVHRAAPEDVAVGSLGSYAGLWLPNGAGAMRFINILDDPSDAAPRRTWPEPDAATPRCPPDAPRAGVMLRAAPTFALGGDGWAGASLPWSVLGRYHLGPAGPCLQAYAGHREDDGASPAPTDGIARFALTAHDQALLGVGESATARHTLRCTLSAPAAR